MKKVVAVILLALAVPMMSIAQTTWNQTFDVVATDPNTRVATSYEFQYRVDAGAWSPTITETTPSTQFATMIDFGQILDVQVRPCDAIDCGGWVIGSITAPPSAWQPLSTITITVPSWSNP